MSDVTDPNVCGPIEEFKTSKWPQVTVKYADYNSESVSRAVLLGIGSDPNFNSSRDSTHICTADSLREMGRHLLSLADTLDRKEGQTTDQTAPAPKIRRRVDL